LGNGFIAFCDQEKLCIQRKEEVKPFHFRVKELPARVQTPAGILIFKKNRGEPLIPYDEFKIKGITVRNRRPGDRVQFKHFSKPLKKLLIEKKIPARERDKLPIVLAGNRIIWIPGLYRAYINHTCGDYVGVRFESGIQNSDT
jgi:tRNA(Ile)-lysidine synthase